MHIRKRADHNRRLLLKRTIAAQIHFTAFVLALAGYFLLFPYVSKLDKVHYWGTVVYGITGMTVFLISATYHFLHDGYEISDRLASVMEHLDQSAIYLFIAGTYTPILLNTIEAPWRNILMIGIWTLAITGIVYTLVRNRLPTWAQSRLVYTSMFVLMGCFLVVRLNEAYTKLNTFGLFCMVAGVVSYVVGAAVYATKKPQLFVGTFGYHELWHLLSTTGFIFHFGMVCSFYIN